MFEGFAQGILQWAPVISGLGALILTAGLVYLYKIQADILGQQTNLLENQHEAKLRVENYFVASAQDLADIFDVDDYPKWLIRTGFLVISLSNFGKGTADDIRALLYFDGDDSYLEINSVMMQGGHLDPIVHTGQGGVLGANERNVRFASWFQASRDALPDDWIPSSEEPAWLTPSEILWAIEDSGVRTIKMGIEIHFKDGTGRRDPIPLFVNEVDLRKRRDFRSAHELGEPLVE